MEVHYPVDAWTDIQSKKGLEFLCILFSLLFQSFWYHCIWPSKTSSVLNRWFSLSPYLVDEGLLVYCRCTLSHAIWGKKKIHFPGSMVTTCHYYLPGQVDPPPNWGRASSVPGTQQDLGCASTATHFTLFHTINLINFCYSSDKKPDSWN